MASGLLLTIAGLLTLPLPIPIGLPLILIGLPLVLKSSRPAKRFIIRQIHKRPRIAHWYAKVRHRRSK